MSAKVQVVRGWIAKAESDFAALDTLLERDRALDAACFHAQQAAEKYLKAYLTHEEVPFPFIHHIEKLLHLCARRDPAFLSLQSVGVQLTPYATNLRYDAEFWPTPDTVVEARDAARAIRQFVLDRLPADQRS